MNEKRLILAIVLSTLVIMLWSTLFTPARRPQKVPTTPAPSPTQQHTGAGQTPQQAARPAPRASGLIPQTPAGGEIFETLETGKIKINFGSFGARIVNYYIKEGKKNEKLVNMVLPSIEGDFTPQMFTTFPEVNFKINKKSSATISFNAAIENIAVTKEYIINDDGISKIILKVKNISGKNKEFNIQMALGPGIGCDPGDRKEEVSLTRVISAVRTAKDKYLIDKNKPGQYFLDKYSWMGMDNRYFCMVILNPDAPKISGHFGYYTVSKLTAEKLYVVNLSTQLMVAAGQVQTLEIPFYVGPKDYTKLLNYGHGLYKIVDFGFFEQFAKLSFYSLKYLYSLTGNYGVAIIILTIILQVLFYPLTMKSYKASASMRNLQPKIKEIQLKYSKDPKRLNAEMLNLYKAQKVNPLGGCLPILVQIPIFWALFVTLRSTYELRKAPFVLWIDDLSTPDLIFSISGIPVRLLPLLMGISMYVQQKLTTVTMDQSQKMLTYIMPVMFTFIFWNFPSGLVLYWLVNNILSISLQYLISKKHTPP
ncbi:MAG: membrane protein insertase YidC, partial [Elusimicrobiota bacterium]